MNALVSLPTVLLDSTHLIRMSCVASGDADSSLQHKDRENYARMLSLLRDGLVIGCVTDSILFELAQTQDAKRRQDMHRLFSSFHHARLIANADVIRLCEIYHELNNILDKAIFPTPASLMLAPAVSTPIETVFYSHSTLIQKYFKSIANDPISTLPSIRDLYKLSCDTHDHNPEAIHAAKGEYVAWQIDQWTKMAGSAGSIVLPIQWAWEHLEIPSDLQRQSLGHMSDSLQRQVEERKKCPSLWLYGEVLRIAMSGKNKPTALTDFVDHMWLSAVPYTDFALIETDLASQIHRATDVYRKRVVWKIESCLDLLQL